MLAAIYGLGRAMDIPARQAFVTDLVGRADLPNAVALNSVVFNSARIVGPAVGGVAHRALRVAMAFFLNGDELPGGAGRAAGDPHRRWTDPAGQVGLRAGLRRRLSYAAATPSIASRSTCWSS